MEPTHFLFLIENPRKDFAATMTAAERELFGRHAAYYREHAKKGLVLMAGPALDDTYGICVLATSDFSVADAFRAGTRWSRKGSCRDGCILGGPASDYSSRQAREA